MDCLKINTHSPEETQKLGMAIGEVAEPGDVYLLIGNLGAGKTCLTQGIAWGIGVKEYALSPSFVLVRQLLGRLPLYHIDLYRLDRLDEIADLGLEDYLYGRGVSVVEWADRGMSLLPAEHLLIRLDCPAENERALELVAKGKRYQRRVERLESIWCGKTKHAAGD